MPSDEDRKHFYFKHGMARAQLNIKSFEPLRSLSSRTTSTGEVTIAAFHYEPTKSVCYICGRLEHTINSCALHRLPQYKQLCGRHFVEDEFLWGPFILVEDWNSNKITSHGAYKMKSPMMPEDDDDGLIFASPMSSTPIVTHTLRIENASCPHIDLRWKRKRASFEPGSSSMYHPSAPASIPPPYYLSEQVPNSPLQEAHETERVMESIMDVEMEEITSMDVQTEEMAMDVKTEEIGEGVYIDAFYESFDAPKYYDFTCPSPPAIDGPQWSCRPFGCTKIHDEVPIPVVTATSSILEEFMAKRELNSFKFKPIDEISRIPWELPPKATKPKAKQSSICNIIKKNAGVSRVAPVYKPSMTVKQYVKGATAPAPAPVPAKGNQGATTSRANVRVEMKKVKANQPATVVRSAYPAEKPSSISLVNRKGAMSMIGGGNKRDGEDKKMIPRKEKEKNTATQTFELTKAVKGKAASNVATLNVKREKSERVAGASKDNTMLKVGINAAKKVILAAKEMNGKEEGKKSVKQVCPRRDVMKFGDKSLILSDKSLVKAKTSLLVDASTDKRTEAKNGAMRSLAKSQVRGNATLPHSQLSMETIRPVGSKVAACGSLLTLKEKPNADKKNKAALECKPIRRKTAAVKNELVLKEKKVVKQRIMVADRKMIVEEKDSRKSIKESNAEGKELVVDTLLEKKIMVVDSKRIAKEKDKMHVEDKVVKNVAEEPSFRRDEVLYSLLTNEKVEDGVKKSDIAADSRRIIQEKGSMDVEEKVLKNVVEDPDAAERAMESSIDMEMESSTDMEMESSMDMETKEIAMELPMDIVETEEIKGGVYIDDFYEWFDAPKYYDFSCPSPPANDGPGWSCHPFGCTKIHDEVPIPVVTARSYIFEDFMARRKLNSTFKPINEIRRIPLAAPYTKPKPKPNGYKKNKAALECKPIRRKIAAVKNELVLKEKEKKVVKQRIMVADRKIMVEGKGSRKSIKE